MVTQALALLLLKSWTPEVQMVLKHKLRGGAADFLKLVFVLELDPIFILLLGSRLSAFILFLVSGSAFALHSNSDTRLAVRWGVVDR